MSGVPTETDLPELISKGIQMVGQRLSAAPDFTIYDSIKNQLEFIRATVQAGRKPSEEEKDRITIGLYAAREFESSDPALADILFDISFLFKRL